MTGFLKRKQVVVLEKREETPVPDCCGEAEDFSQRADGLHLNSKAYNAG